MIDKFYETNILCIADKERQRQIEKILQQLILTKEKTEKVKATFINEVNLALAEQPSSLQMENTYIPELPEGTEEGKFLALDLGGTNFRAILLHILGGNVIHEVVKRYDLAHELRNWKCHSTNFL